MCALAAALHRLLVRRLHTEFYIWPDRRAAACALGKSSRDDSDLYLAQYRRAADLARNWRSITVWHPRTLFADENQNAGRESQNSGHYDRDGDGVNEGSNSNENKVDREQKHTEVLCDVHASF